jgi:raffinose/stachyose/melibiose transport system substrate-binding protein
VDPSADKDSSSNKQGIGSDLGYFPFPAVDGGAGSIDDVMGGGGFVLGRNAPPVAVDFLKYLSSAGVESYLAHQGLLLPATKGAEGGVTDPLLRQVQASVAKAPYYQLYYDQFLPPVTASTLLNSVQGLYAGILTPDAAAKAIAASAESELKK